MEVELPMSILVGVVYWGLLAGGDPGAANFTSLIQHGINIAMIVGDFGLNGLHMSKIHIIFAVLFASLYLVVHYLVILVEYFQGFGARVSYGFLSVENIFVVV